MPALCREIDPMAQTAGCDTAPSDDVTATTFSPLSDRPGVGMLRSECFGPPLPNCLDGAKWGNDDRMVGYSGIRLSYSYQITGVSSVCTVPMLLKNVRSYYHLTEELQINIKDELPVEYISHSIQILT